MNCDAACDLLLDHAEGCLEAQQSAALEEHLRACSSCRFALQQTRELVGAMGDIRKRQESASQASRAASVQPDFAAWQPGSRLADFEILGELGRGGMGIVYRARQVSLNRLVALKVLPASIRQFPSAIARFKKEAQAAAKLHHTNIVPVYSQGEHEGHFYYAMELIEGEGLDTFIKEGKANVLEHLSSRVSRPPESQSGVGGRRNLYRFVARLMAGVADGLEHAHQQGVIHRDIKPQNLLMAGDGQLHITDFGLARLLDEPSITMTGEMVGTPAYMSPEQVAGDRHAVDHRTDIYSLGVTFYELLTGARPFDGVGRDQVIAKIMTREPKPPRRINPQVPVDLETICLRSMEKEPGRRYASAGAMATDLRRYADNMAILIRRSGPIERATKWVRRHPAITSICGLVLALAAVTTVWRVQAERARAIHVAEMHSRADDLVRQAYNRLAFEDYREPKIASGLLEQAGALGPSDWEYRRALGLASLHTDPKAAIEHLSWVVDQRPSDANAKYLLAWAQRLRADRVDGTVCATLEKADALGGPTTAEGHFFKGMVLIREMDESEGEFRKAVELRDNYAQALTQLGRALNHWMYHNRKQDKFDELKRRLENACDLQKRQAYPRYLLSLGYRISAEIYEEAGDAKSAEEPFRSALKFARDAQSVEPSSARGFVAEAEYWETRRNYEEAMKYRNLSEPLCIKPEAINELYQYRWRLHFWLGNHEAALSDLRAVGERRDDSDPKGVWYRGFFPALVMADQGDLDTAATRVLEVARARISFRSTCAAASLLRLLGRNPQAESLIAELRDRIDYVPLGAAEISPNFMRESLALLAGRIAAKQLLDRQDALTAGRIGPALPGLFSACIAVGNGERSGALGLYQQCDQAYDSEDYCYLARVFVRRLEKDPDWPAWIPQTEQGSRRTGDGTGNSPKK